MGISKYNGEYIFTTEAIKPFLNEKVDRNKIETSSFLNSFARLDDYDVFSCIKEWVNDKDPVLSMLSNGVVNRKLPKVLISKEKFSDEEVQNHLIIHQKKLGFSNDEMKYFVFQIILHINQCTRLDPRVPVFQINLIIFTKFTYDKCNGCNN